MKLVFPRLYAIMTAELVRTSEIALAEMLAASGVALIQYRNKFSSTRRLFEACQALARQMQPRGVRVMVNDRADVAALAGAGGVHVGQDDLAVEQARALCGAERWVGVSTHTLEQVREAEKTSADYIAFGPIFETRTKENPHPVVGLELLRRARELTTRPLVAIGGITLERAEAVYAAGADSLAVARDLLGVADPGVRAKEYLAAASQQAFSRG